MVVVDNFRAVGVLMLMMVHTGVAVAVQNTAAVAVDCNSKAAAAVNDFEADYIVAGAAAEEQVRTSHHQHEHHSLAAAAPQAGRSCFERQAFLPKRIEHCFLYHCLL